MKTLTGDIFFHIRDDVSMEESGYDAKRYGALPTERPLVHVFLVQESMQLDALQAVSKNDCYPRPGEEK